MISVRSPQGDGPDVQLRVFGDEFYSRCETPKGHTVVYDLKKEKFCYATLEAGHFASTGIPSDQPAPTDLRYHIQEDKAVRNEAFSRRYNEMRPRANLPPGIFRALGKYNGLIDENSLSIGKVRGLTIMIDFQDEQTSITQNQINEFLNGDDFTAYGNYCSVKEYFEIMSGCKLKYTNEVVGPVRLSKNKMYYHHNPCMKEALDKAVSKFNLDLSKFDSKDRGVIDAINFVYAGQVIYRGWLHPHNHNMDAHGNSTYNGTKADLYTIQNLGRVAADMKIGTFCHEAGHLICRFPDLYDYGNRDEDFDPSEGFGRYCLMGSGNHLGGGRVPAPICAYLRELADWTEEVSLNEDSTFQIEHGKYNCVYKYKISKSNEYFLIENRMRMGLDKYCPSSGLGVYHCDTRGSNEWQDGTAERHYQCALIQADGRRDLEDNRNRGDTTDLFKERSGVALAHNTVPHSRAWDGTDSGLKISNISAPGAVISVDLGEPKESDGPIVKESFPSALIPDSDPEGIMDTITVLENKKITALRVEIDISHTYVGDLKIQLITPHGFIPLKQTDRGDSGDDWRVVYNINSPIVDGKSTAGNWSLRVADIASQDVGVLNSWKVAIGFTS
uniref:M6 family metalloprotease domain-containing protein n=1 Tax=Candidatus Kentrum sp. LFY TaxID=2126342 RepID=A0A450UH13_9GAMM|nr:MAG: M6 family metalloprotease domain-containing protein [Candidatus Kentron sp. LFY]